MLHLRVLQQPPANGCSPSRYQHFSHPSLVRKRRGNDTNFSSVSCANSRHFSFVQFGFLLLFFFPPVCLFVGSFCQMKLLFQDSRLTFGVVALVRFFLL